MAIEITQPHTVELTGNPISVPVKTDTEGVSFHYLHLEIYEPDGTTLIAEAKLPALPSDDIFSGGESGAIFDISEYLKREQRNHYTHNKPYSFIIEAYPLLAYRLSAYETYNNDGQKHNQTPVYSQKYALQGGISQKLFNQYRELETHFYERWIQTRKFLTWQQDEVITHRNGYDRLYLCAISGTALKLKVKLYFDDSTEHEFIKQSRPISAWRIYEIITSFKLLDLEDFETSSKKITHYDIWLEDENYAVVSETFRYTLDEKYYHDTKDFLFKNSFGVFEYVRFTGIYELNQDFDFELVRTEIRKKHNVSANDLISANSGFLENREVIRLKELYFSTEAYEIRGIHIHGIVITSAKRNVEKKKVFLYSAEIEYYLDEEEEYYAELLEEYHGMDQTIFMIVDDEENDTPFLIIDDQGQEDYFYIIE